jgi:hypothetical protein
MQTTRHINDRMNQRGLKREMIELALEHGKLVGDKYVLNRKLALATIGELKKKQKALEHAASKGGVTVIASNETLITAYRTDSFSRKAGKVNA